jgi:hypothetical protein
MKNFEEKLNQMTKPEILQLKHQDMLAKELVKSKEKSIISWWWLVVPLYIIAAFVMKSIYMPQTNLFTSIDDFFIKEKSIAVFFFLIMPIALIVINFLSLKRLYFLSGNPRTLNFLKTIWFNISIIIISILILIFYSL